MLLKRLPTATVLIFSIIYFIFTLQSWYFVLICSVIMAGGLWEYFHLMDKKGYHPLVFFGMFSGLVIMLIQYITSAFHGLYIYKEFFNLIYFLIILGVFLVALSRFNSISPINTFSATITGIFYVAWLFSFVIKIRCLPTPYGNWYILFMLIVTKITDVSAYCFGTLFGRTKLVPHISPKKTVLGGIAGFFFAVFASLCFKILFPLKFEIMGYLDIVILGALLGFFSQIGDLIESIIKRDVGVKDSGSVFPGMGGFLDIIDSILVTAPIMYFYMLIIL
ncbi:phosphatidate cytidylyltransferase [Chlamydiota bacterium]